MPTSEKLKTVGRGVRYQHNILNIFYNITNYILITQGPLAKEVPGEQVKQLVRALFQNTERRAALLAKIK